MIAPNQSTSVSVIATVRNEREGIDDFIQSLLNQSLQPDEIIIVDGVSTDGTLDVLRSYERQGLIRVISQACNISEGRNLGVAAARSNIIAATDAGCKADPRWLEELVAGFNQDPAPDVVAGNYDFETHTDFEVASCFATNQPDRESSDSAKYYPSSRSIAFLKSAWEAVKGYPEWLYAAEDTLYNIQLRRKGFRFHFAQDAKVRWRPRTTWRGLYRQYFNYARGNGRIGLGLAGYASNIRTHGVIAALTCLGLIWPPLLVLALLAAASHVQTNLWQQAKYAEATTGKRSILWLTLLAMEVVRIAGMAGYIAGRLDRRRDPRFIRCQEAWMGIPSVESSPPLPHWTSLALGLSVPTQVLLTFLLWDSAAALPALVLTLLLAVKSVLNFSRTGPELKDEIQQHYSRYSLLALLRLTGWAFVLCLIMAGYGQTILAAWGPATPSTAEAWIASLAAIGLLSGYQFCRHLLFIPASLAASSNYRLSRFYPLWSLLSPLRLTLVGGLIGGIFAAAAIILLADMEAPLLGAMEFLLPVYFANSALLLLAATWTREPQPPRHGVKQPGSDSPEKKRLNLLMIGCDTLRADRLGIERYPRGLTPHLDSLAGRGIYLSKCYVPCARTAPSLASMLTGLWPQHHGIRDNFSLTSEAQFLARPLPHVLADAGYQTIAISDWAGGDLGKFDFGFQFRHLPEDQWNIKYLIRQGPKDIRLFLSLFTHNRFGKRYLPELYYLASIPMTDELGRTTRESIKQAADQGAPFFINTFFSTTHAPFGSEYPYYTLFSDRRHKGDSKFVMANLDDPMEIIRRQRDRAEEVDLDQILSLYDGCVRRFDDEVGHILRYLEDSGLAANTLVVVYSDHGIDFFENESWGQGNSVVSDESARVPIIIAGPRITEPKIVSTTTRTVDLAPTLLNLLGLTVPPEVDGISLAGPERSFQPKDLPVYGETGIWFTRVPSMPEGHHHYPDLSELLEVPEKGSGALAVKPRYKEVVVSAKDRMLRYGNWKLVRLAMENGPHYNLYDMTQGDRDGKVDLSTLHPDLYTQLRTQLDALESGKNG